MLCSINSIFINKVEVLRAKKNTQKYYYNCDKIFLLIMINYNLKNLVFLVKNIEEF